MELEYSANLRWVLGATIVVYVVAMYGLAWFAKGKIHNSEDYLVAGRRLPLSLAWMTILATWFGAGTLLAATDEVRLTGLQGATLDPLGAGVCLLLVGMFMAGPMWRMKLLTLCDMFRERFGRTAELLSAVVLVPSYLGWVAAQFVALAGMLELFFGLDPQWGLLLVAVIGTGYTLMGGMWSVTLTDAVQIILVLLGLLVLLAVVLLQLGDGSALSGLRHLMASTPPDRLELIPRESTAKFMDWLTVFAIGSMGNMASQDLMQRVFASKNETIARRGLYVAGVAYLVFGSIPVILGLAAPILLPDMAEKSVLAILVHEFLSPPLAIVFTLVLMSAVLSTIDSAILAPASVVAQNLLPRLTLASPLLLDRLSVLGVAACSLALAYRGERAYALLEESYALGLVGLFVPMMLGIYTLPRSGAPAIASMLVGMLVWGVHFYFEWEVFLPTVAWIGVLAIPAKLAATAIALFAYFVCEPPWRMRRAV
ncbi:MAG: sodium:solute symporter family protein [Planctomycetales bacterium]|nr:sodium:solute symporter family protein [Planctomycetales bacterium]